MSQREVTAVFKGTGDLLTAVSFDVDTVEYDGFHFVELTITLAGMDTTVRFDVETAGVFLDEFRDALGAARTAQRSDR